MFPQIPIVLYL